MREILFKAKSLDSGEWVYGWYCKYPFGRWPVKPCIIPSVEAEDGEHKHIEVDPETVCQYTGLTDKNGVRIFEGDILNIPGTKRPGIPAPVRYLQDQCQFVISRGGYNPIWISEYDAEKYMEVIGNIHDKEADNEPTV